MDLLGMACGQEAGFLVSVLNEGGKGVVGHGQWQGG